MRMFVAVQLALQEFLAGDLIAARRWDLKALEFTELIGNPRAFTGVYETAAYIAAHEGRAELAARLMGAAEAGRIMSGAPQASYWVAPHAAAWEQICARVGAAAAQEFFTAGRRAVPREWSTVAAEYLSS
jgi:hypothetical protein